MPPIFVVALAFLSVIPEGNLLLPPFLPIPVFLALLPIDPMPSVKISITMWDFRGNVPPKDSTLQ